MDGAKLLALLEAARDGSEYLDYAIQRAFFGTAKPVPLYTRSVDAALSLVPEGWTIHRLGQITDCKGGFAGWLADIYQSTDAVIHYPAEGTAPNAALAICVAAVRTRFGMAAKAEAEISRRAAR